MGAWWVLGRHTWTRRVRGGARGWGGGRTGQACTRTFFVDGDAGLHSYLWMDSCVFKGVPGPLVAFPCRAWQTVRATDRGHGATDTEGGFMV
jgi:hypothetical protein